MHYAVDDEKYFKEKREKISVHLRRDLYHVLLKKWKTTKG